jgi:hypothetical protein
MEYETYPCDGIDYIIPFSMSPDEPVYRVSISQLDTLWKNTAKETYIGENQGNLEKRDTVFRALQVNPRNPLDIPEILVKSPNKVSFIDGRHRFSGIRDRGNQYILVTLSLLSDDIDIESLISAKRIN